MVGTVFEPFTCAECGGQVQLATGPGRVREYRRGIPPMPVPDDFPIPTCTRCGETYVLPETAEELEQALAKQFLEWQRVHLASIVELFQCLHSATKRQIASVVGVTPSHLSHLLAGQDIASLTLQRLFEALAVCPAEFERHVSGRQFSIHDCYPFLVQRRDRENFERGRRAAGGDYRWSALAGPTAANDNTVGEAV